MREKVGLNRLQRGGRGWRENPRRKAITGESLKMSSAAYYHTGTESKQMWECDRARLTQEKKCNKEILTKYNNMFLVHQPSFYCVASTH